MYCKHNSNIVLIINLTVTKWQCFNFEFCQSRDRILKGYPLGEIMWTIQEEMSSVFCAMGTWTVVFLFVCSHSDLLGGGTLWDFHSFCRQPLNCWPPVSLKLSTALLTPLFSMPWSFAFNLSYSSGVILVDCITEFALDIKFFRYLTTRVVQMQHDTAFACCQMEDFLCTTLHHIAHNHLFVGVPELHCCLRCGLCGYNEGSSGHCLDIFTIVVHSWGIIISLAVLEVC